MEKPNKKEILELVTEVTDERILDLKKVIERQRKKIDKLSDKKADMIEAMNMAISDGIKELDLRPVKPPTKSKKKLKSQPEICVPLLSDIQLAKVTPTYSTEIAEERVVRYAEKICKLADIQRSDHAVNKCIVLALGDIVEGELIFPGQSHLIDSSLYSQVTVDGPRILYKFFSILLSHFDEVECHWVIGNHGSLGGRARKDMHPESNADAMLGNIMSQLFSNEPRMKWHVAYKKNERAWYTVANLGRKARFFCFHGDQVRGFAGFPWYGFGKKIQGWKTLASQGLMEDFDYAVAGHFHTPNTQYINDIRFWCNGSTESYNTFAQEQLASMGRPCQYVLFVKPNKGVTAEYLVDLE
tara:strand:+ start:494 stop:1561 length:1068 start_codon:yes stop_codon:yes gene_type:complete